jgi:protein-L-isoaspartate(D-aspartate) O-methyltransferase
MKRVLCHALRFAFGREDRLRIPLGLSLRMFLVRFWDFNVPAKDPLHRSVDGTRAQIFLVCGILSALLPGASSLGGDEAERRRHLVEQELIPAGIESQAVIQSVLSTPRHEFVPRDQRQMAYFDMALPIGNEQTISSPFIVAFMTQVAQPKPTDRVLEIGTGSGYQAAIISPLVKDVYTIEIVEELGERARKTLKRLGYENVHVKIGDGFKGWPEYAPFDIILVTCSPEDVPRPLIEQLQEGGKLVIPVGERYQQTLYLMTKKEGELVREPLHPTLFVPMTGEAEAQRVRQPDPQTVTVVNGSFEHDAEGSVGIPGWYYERQVAIVEISGASLQAHAIHFSNTSPGRASHLLQGLALDGRHVSKIKIKARIRFENVTKGPQEAMQPAVAMSFYDSHRATVSERWLGPWTGTKGWHTVEGEFPVGKNVREAILRLGLFGGTGEFFVDEVEITKVSR